MPAWSRRSILILAVFALLFVAIVVKNAWMSDDAYITLRTVDNFVRGYGLTWNPVERVQAFTHPLWMFVLSIIYLLTRDAYYTTLLLSIALSLVTVLLLAFRVATSAPAALFAIVALMLSRTFVDYSTSGLENSLTHLLLVLFFVVYFRYDIGSRKLFLLSFIIALIALNRLDAILLLLPLFALAIYEHRTLLSIGSRIKLVAVGFMPLFVWEVFSVLYYGFAVPNTYFAKLNTGIAQSVLAFRGITYFLDTARLDPLTPLLIVSGLVLAFATRRKANVFIGVGVVLYLLYVVRIGGDFMAGRFLSAPLLCALVVMCRWEWLSSYACSALPITALLLVGLIPPHSPVRGDAFTNCHIQGATDAADERGCYLEGTGLFKQKPGAQVIPDHALAEDGLRQRTGLAPVSIMGAIGMYGYYAGPNHYVLDLNALANPLLARLPVPNGKTWRIGHFERLIPAGYLETLVSGQNRICDPNLAEYYDQLALVVRGPLLDPRRLVAIWKLNTGQYDSLVRAYDATHNATNQLCDAQAAVDVAFAGGPRLRGYTISTDHAKPGDELVLSLYWQGKPERNSDLAGFVHIRNSRPGGPNNPLTGNEIWAQQDRYSPGGRLPGEYWPAQIYLDQVYLRLPDNMSPGEYFVEVGWFDPQAGEQLEPQPDTVKSPMRILWRSVLLPNLTVQ